MLPLITASPTAGTIKLSDTQCGRTGGVGTSTSGVTVKTVCCKFMLYTIYESTNELLQYSYSHFLAKAVPFRLEFYSDGYEWADPGDGKAKNKGAKIYYFQTTC